MSRSDWTTTEEQLNALWAARDDRVRDFDVKAGFKLAVVSDLHLGDGSDADDFRDNEPALRAALRSYQAGGFGLVLLGDVEDLWKFDLGPVAERYDGTIYQAFRSFKPRPLRVFGNHDLEWRRPPDPAGAEPAPMAAGYPEAVRLVVDGKARALMVHGHQGTVDSDRGAWFSRFFVHVWGSVEPLIHALGLHPTNPSATQSAVMGDYEQTFYAWAKRYATVVICGHSHRAYFASRSRADQLRDQSETLIQTTALGGVGLAETKLKLQSVRVELEDERKKGRDIGPLESVGTAGTWYYNTGCGLYTSGVTAIEVERAEGAGPLIRLVFWDRNGDKKVWGEGPL